MPTNGKKVKLYVWLIKHHTMKAYGGVEVQCHVFVTSALYRSSGQLHAPAYLAQGKKPPASSPGPVLCTQFQFYIKM